MKVFGKTAVWLSPPTSRFILYANGTRKEIFEDSLPDISDAGLISIVDALHLRWTLDQTRRHLALLTFCWRFDLIQNLICIVIFKQFWIWRNNLKPAFSSFTLGKDSSGCIFWVIFHFNRKKNISVERLSSGVVFPQCPKSETCTGIFTIQGLNGKIQQHVSFDCWGRSFI